jgi:hypothetical protein
MAVVFDETNRLPEWAKEQLSKAYPNSLYDQDHCISVEQILFTQGCVIILADIHWYSASGPVGSYRYEYDWDPEESRVIFVVDNHSYVELDPNTPAWSIHLSRSRKSVIVEWEEWDPYLYPELDEERGIPEQESDEGMKVHKREAIMLP